MSKVIVGKFTDDAGRPAQTLWLELSDEATVKSTGQKLGDLSEPFVIEIPLDEHGAIPEGTTVPFNDEIDPEDTSYRACVHEASFDRWLYLTGDGPINLNTLPTAREMDEAKEAREKEERLARKLASIPPPRPRSTTRKTGVVYGGWFGGVINCPAANPSGDPVIVGNGSFEDFTFVLPLRAVVNEVTVIVEDTHVQGGKVVIKLRNLSTGKEYAASIDASTTGLSTGEFPEEITLAPGDYSISWSVSLGVKVKGLALNEFCGRRTLPFVYFKA